MRDRCYNPNSNSYRYYGAKGVSICQEWQAFKPFYDWAMANGYNDKLTIDRKNVFGNYEPSNCRWATTREQNNNTTRNVFITIGSETKTVQQWAEEAGISRNTILYRLRHGMAPEDAVLAPRYNRSGNDK